MSATANTRRPLINNVGVWLTSNDCPNSIDFLTLASVPAAAAQEAIFSASRPAAGGSSFSLSSAVGSAVPPLFPKNAPRGFQDANGVAPPAQAQDLPSVHGQGVSRATRRDVT